MEKNDIPFLLSEMKWCGVLGLFLDNHRFGFVLDTVDIVKKCIRDGVLPHMPYYYTLGNLYSFSTGTVMENSKREYYDAKETAKFLLVDTFWDMRFECM